MQSVAASDEYSATASINLNALSASKFKALLRGMREILSRATG
ncbi:hypothetical protein CAMGR0001_2513 [Campylobacter gracilis RM3268]|uniref:Uncharacterized protein n=1 Tax=Campylobacter gracilis RM3268 TaxID=553220 RepID=C8PEM4_9BACT|nr:hypothetical protein CAMGR0001_2513 [Campylobacter gracilis RM3268]